MDVLKTSVKNCNKTVVPFVIEFNTSLPNIGKIINKYWDLLKLSPNFAVRALHNYKPVVAFKRARNIKDILVKTNFQNSSDKDYMSYKCSRARCSHCCNIVEGNSFSSSNNQTEFKIGFNASCTSTNVIYLITCKKCEKQYVGQTGQQVGKRMNSHRFDINSFTDPAFSTHVATHFNEGTHSLKDFSFMPIDNVQNSMERLMKETYWIHKLGTVFPQGLNSKLLYNVD